MAILSSPDKKLVLSDIYQWILDHYPYFRTRGPGWRNSIRHNLSLNDCFMKAGRSANGKGHYWAIHPANITDFQRGDFRRRKAQRKVRRHMGLEPPGPDDEDDDDDVNLAATTAFMRHHHPAAAAVHFHHHHLWPAGGGAAAAAAAAAYGASTLRNKRTFDMASLLAPDVPEAAEASPEPKRRRDDEDEEEIDVLAGGNDGDGDAEAGSDNDKPDDVPNDVPTDSKHVLRPNFDLAAFYADYARARLVAAAALNPVTSEDKARAPLWFNPQGFYPYPATSEADPNHPKKPIRVAPFLDSDEQLHKDSK